MPVDVTSDVGVVRKNRNVVGKKIGKNRPT